MRPATVARRERSTHPLRTADEGTATPALAPICRFCGHPPDEDPISPGPDLGTVHRACFIRWDRQQEALELESIGGTLFPDPIAFRTDLELKIDDAVARAA